MHKSLIRFGAASLAVIMYAAAYSITAMLLSFFLQLQHGWPPIETIVWPTTYTLLAAQVIPMGVGRGMPMALFYLGVLGNIYIFNIHQLRNPIFIRTNFYCFCILCAVVPIARALIAGSPNTFMLVAMVNSMTAIFFTWIVYRTLGAVVQRQSAPGTPGKEEEQ